MIYLLHNEGKVYQNLHPHTQFSVELYKVHCNLWSVFLSTDTHTHMHTHANNNNEEKKRNMIEIHGL